MLLANPRGFCAGVTRAIEGVERDLMTFGRPVYIRRPIVHNQTVTDRLAAMGAIFVREIEEVPEGAAVILSAHGVAPSVRRAAIARSLKVIDATCPLVAKVHSHVIAHYRAGRHILLIGHADHPEIIGTLAQVPPDGISLVSAPGDVAALGVRRDTKIAYAVQTTFSVRDARAIVAEMEGRFADIVGPRAGNICYATTNRQVAVASIAGIVDCLLVVGDTQSSNANRLVEVALAAGCKDSMLVRDRCDLDWAVIDKASAIGLTAAASTPDSNVQDICAALATQGLTIREYEGLQETATFRPMSMVKE
ncbi:4-hydroxy-3-methylbut-2-enyl diphosphate reductase [Novosphingobium sp. P6W]|uniref:4-hydroxy-3-methylbut-2-enyl diphosphate reductase n=1 Tax=Novosphingobium sp. P6W TaxID=1609758 RepID=UPI0013B374E3|nr:4-hydroxy-3-methylbut-2-enyl diphosphate reductase [Novosphingobium sp. P6W]